MRSQHDSIKSAESVTAPVMYDPLADLPPLTADPRQDNISSMSKETSPVPAELLELLTSSGHPETDLATLAAQQEVGPVHDIQEIIGDFWPEDESCDQFITEIRRLRQAG